MNEEKPVEFTICDSHPPSQHIIVFLPVKNRKTITNQGENEVVVTDVGLTQKDICLCRYGSVVEALAWILALLHAA